MKNVNPVVASFVELLNEIQTEYEKREEKLIAIACADNRGLEPIRDRLGRLHAPVNGYWWEESAYAGGSYLPVETCFKQSPNQTARFKTDVETVELLAELLADTEYQVSAGRSWNQSGVSICYCYIKGLTQAQVNTVVAKAKTISEATEEKVKANKGTAPEGRIGVAGKIISIYSESFGNGYSEIVTHKMVVELANGATVIGTLPRALYEAEEGALVTFMATFEHKRGDDTTAYFKRPSKASM